MKKIIALILLSFIFQLVVLDFTAYSKDNPAAGAEKQFIIDVNNAKCPVMGGDARKDIYSIHDGKIYHFCCPACVPEFRKDPAKFIAKLRPAEEKKQAKIEIAGNEFCPVTGEAVDKNITAVKDGKLYYLCCEDCVAKFLKDDSGKDAQKHDH